MHLPYHSNLKSLLFTKAHSILLSCIFYHASLSLSYTSTIHQRLFQEFIAVESSSSTRSFHRRCQPLVTIMNLTQQTKHRMATSQLQALLDTFEARLSAVEQAVGTGGGTASVARAPGNAGNLPASVMAFDEYCSKCLEPFVAACEKLGGGAAAGVSLSSCRKSVPSTR